MFLRPGQKRKFWSEPEEAGRLLPVGALPELAAVPAASANRQRQPPAAVARSGGQQRWPAAVASSGGAAVAGWRRRQLAGQRLAGGHPSSPDLVVAWVKPHASRQAAVLHIRVPKTHLCQPCYGT